MIISRIISFNIPQHNRFSALNSINNSEDMSGNSPAYSSHSNGFNTYNKPLFAQMISHSREKTNTRSQKPPHRSDYDFNSHNQLLYSPNGRSSSTPNYGVGYNNNNNNNNHPFSDSCIENSNFSS